jgi:hypothetical protein
MSENNSKESHLSYLKGYTIGKDYPMSDQAKGVQIPAYEKPVREGQTIVALPDATAVKLAESDVLKCLNNRVSSRVFKNAALTLDELSFLLWAAQGVKKKADDDRHQHHAIKRTVPSAGSRHPFETYVAVSNVEGLAPCIYRYLASINSLVLEKKPEDLGSHRTALLWSCTGIFLVERRAVPHRLEIRSAFLDQGDHTRWRAHRAESSHRMCRTRPRNLHDRRL